MPHCIRHEYHNFLYPYQFATDTSGVYKYLTRLTIYTQNCFLPCNENFLSTVV